MALVLIVDDVRDGRGLMVRVLRQVGGYETVTADGGRTALVLLDVAMPGMDGFEVLRRLKARHNGATPPVVMLTAYGDEANRGRAAPLGAAGYFVKGRLDLNRLLAAVDTLAGDARDEGNKSRSGRSRSDTTNLISHSIQHRREVGRLPVL